VEAGGDKPSVEEGLCIFSRITEKIIIGFV